jgi:uncharacterized membrane protein YdjX (TVP38/TMEM64 family)
VNPLASETLKLYPGRVVGVSVLILGMMAYLQDAGARAHVDSAVSLAIRADIAPLRDYLLAWGWWAPLVSTLLQVLTSIFAPLPSFMLAFANAMLFGLWWGGLLTWTSALLAAAICFKIARQWGRPAVRRFVPQSALDSTDRFFLRHGLSAVLVARVIPFINPDVVSYAAGLTPMRWRPFMLSIGAGSLPSTALYSYLGSRGITTVGWLFVPLIVLGIAAFLGAMLHRYREALPSPRGLAALPDGERAEG